MIRRAAALALAVLLAACAQQPRRPAPGMVPVQPVPRPAVPIPPAPPPELLRPLQEYEAVTGGVF
jgi:hypothetical protein